MASDKFMKLNMYCKHNDCKKFKLIILLTNNGAIVEVYSSSKNFSHNSEEQFTTQVQGDERKILAEELKYKSAFKYRQECVLSVSPTKLKECGNLQKIKLPTMLRKLNSEQQLKGDFNRDNFIDIQLMAKEHPWLNMAVSDPFNVIWASQHQLEIVKNLSRSNELTTMYMDSTGTVVRPPLSSKIKPFTIMHV